MAAYTKGAVVASLAQYDDILKGKYPAKAHAKRVEEYVKAKVSDLSGILYVEGGMTKMVEDSDAEEPFRQRRPFFYLTGCPLADCHFIYDLSTSKSILFIPPIEPDSVIWSGLPTTVGEAQQLYDVDDVRYTTDLNATLAHLGAANGGITTVFALADRVSDHVSFLGFGTKNFSLLKEAIDNCRVVKSEYELALICRANKVTAAAHRAILERVRKADNETQLEAAFLYACVAAGAKNQAYSPIVASGRAASTLHYTKNSEPMAGKLNLLVDAAAEWDCYAADVTRTMPIRGKFSRESQAIYDIVLKMQAECTDMLREGVVWDDVHLTAHKIAIDGLLKLGIMKGDPDEILKARTSVAFFPHGLGHYLGMDTHDTGGNANYADKDPMFRYLRVRGKLPSGSVITVEPGVYFCEFIIEPYLQDPNHCKFIDELVLDKYWDIGGVRIEDNVLITKDGSYNMTTAIKDPTEMEKIITSG